MYEKLGYNLKIKVEGFDEILTQNIISRSISLVDNNNYLKFSSRLKSKLNNNSIKLY